MSKNNLRQEILQLEAKINIKKLQLFTERLETICAKKFAESNIFDVNINIVGSTWQISYLHKTTNYNPNNYAYNEDSEDDTSEVSSIKETRIVFGKNHKYFVKGGIKLHIYRNTVGELRVINPDYEFEIDLEEQRNLVNSYSQNIDLPEWMALSVLLYLSDNKWDDQAIINHLSTV